jgi:membrane protein DedA with SNARE-associated domain
VTHFVSHYGLWVVFGVVFLEVVGLPFIPGETALIVASALASQGKGSLPWTIALAVVAAILGYVVAYAIGRARGRDILSFWPWLERVTKPGVDKSEEFFHRHGPKTVFLGRFFPFLRATVGWMAGVGRMPWPKFLAWNVLGALVWCPGVGLASYYAGQAVVDTIQRDAAIGAGVVAGLVIVAAGVHFLLRRLERA